MARRLAEDAKGGRSGPPKAGYRSNEKRQAEASKRFSRDFVVSFGGGEPLVKKDVFDILDYCKQEGIIANITTNGLLLNERNAQRLIDSNIYNINISVDSMIGEVNDNMRGVPGYLEKVKSNVENLLRYRDSVGSRVTVFFKSVVCAENIKDIHLLPECAREIGLSGVSFQPIRYCSEESTVRRGQRPHGPLWRLRRLHWQYRGRSDIQSMALRKDRKAAEGFDPM